MYIKEVSLTTNLSKKTIHFYEQVGLISPAILENGYRVYSPDDVNQLNKISFLRQLDMSIPKIKELMLSDTQELDILLAHKHEMIQKEDEMSKKRVLIDRVVSNHIDPYLSPTQISVSDARCSSILIGRKYSRMFVFLAILLSVVLSYIFMLVFRLFIDTFITFYITLIIFLPIALAQSINQYWVFEHDGFIAFPKKGSFSPLEHLLQVFKLFITNDTTPFENKVPLSDIIDIEIIWYKQVTNGFTPEKLSLFIHLIDKSSIEIDLMYLDTTEKLVEISQLLACHGIPTIDSYTIISAIASGENLYEYLQSLKMKN